MPTYEYACRSCGRHIDVQQSFTDDALTTCPTCGGQLRKVFGNIAISFKGTGFYSTDNRSLGKSGTASKGDAEAGASADAGAGDGKGDSKSSSEGASSSSGEGSSSASEGSAKPSDSGSGSGSKSDSGSGSGSGAKVTPKSGDKSPASAS
jgi:putative FmdB family regulatory protein